jgi:hypothetical protein
MDADNAVKIAYMLEDNKVSCAELERLLGAAATAVYAPCPRRRHRRPSTSRTAALASGKYYDLIQWTSKGGKFDGYVADKRVMEGGKALVDAKGEKKGDDWTVTFTRKLAGGEGDVALASGKVVNIGFAIHDDHAIGRYHHVSFGYTLGLDAKADISAAKQ